MGSGMYHWYVPMVCTYGYEHTWLYCPRPWGPGCPQTKWLRASKGPQRRDRARDAHGPSGSPCCWGLASPGLSRSRSPCSSPEIVSVKLHIVPWYDKLPKQQWPDLTIFFDFGNILSLWDNFYGLLCRIWQNLKPTFAKLCNWAIFHLFNGHIFKK